MKLVGAISTAVLSLTLGAGIPAYAQQEQHEQQQEKEKPAQEREKQARPEQPAKQEKKNARQEDKNTRPEEGNAKQEKNNNKEEKSAQEQHSREAKVGRQDERARGNGGGGRIPDRFRANFGQEHRFRVNQADYNNRRFQYGGYWFGFEGSWPSNWQYTQEVFVIEIDGVYYLCNANYPGVNIALSIAM